jgi:hypothetical protein
MQLDILVRKVENGYIVSISGATMEAFLQGSRKLDYVFNTWEAACGFISSLNDKFK